MSQQFSGAWNISYNIFLHPSSSENEKFKSSISPSASRFVRVTLFLPADKGNVCPFIVTVPDVGPNSTLNPTSKE